MYFRDCMEQVHEHDALSVCHGHADRRWAANNCRSQPAVLCAFSLSLCRSQPAVLCAFAPRLPLPLPPPHSRTLCLDLCLSVSLSLCLSVSLSQVGVVGCAVNVCVLSCLYRETLPANERVPLSIRGSNPFSFGKLLTHGDFSLYCILCACNCSVVFR